MLKTFSMIIYLQAGPNVPIINAQVQQMINVPCSCKVITRTRLSFFVLSGMNVEVVLSKGTMSSLRSVLSKIIFKNMVQKARG